MTDHYDWRADAYRSWELAIAVKRERGVREGRYAPQSPQEARWAAEGPVQVQSLEVVRA